MCSSSPSPPVKASPRLAAGGALWTEATGAVEVKVGPIPSVSHCPSVPPLHPCYHSNHPLLLEMLLTRTLTHDHS